MIPEEVLAESLKQWRAKAFELCRKRGWSELAGHRFMIHILECAEFQESLRGKREGLKIVEEAGDMIFTALAMIPEDISLQRVVSLNFAKIETLMTAPPYEGEKHDDIDWKVIFMKLLRKVASVDSKFVSGIDWTVKEEEAIKEAVK